MSLRALFRLSGLALLVALVLEVIGWALHPPAERLVDLLSPGQTPAHVIQFLASALLILGLPGMYARQAQRAGILGLLGFVLLVLGASAGKYTLLFEAFPAPLLAREAPDLIAPPNGPLRHGMLIVGLLSLPILVGVLLLGIATVRAGVFSAWSGFFQTAFVCSVPITFISGSSGTFVLPLPTALTPVALSSYLLFAGYAWAGYQLWTSRVGREVAARVPGAQVQGRAR